MTKRINVPPMSEKPVDQVGLISRIWYSFFVDLQKAVNASSDAGVKSAMSITGAPSTSDTEVMGLFDTKGLMTPAMVTELDELDYVQSPTILTGGGITGGTNAGTYKVSTLTAKLRVSNSTTAELVTVTLAEQDNQTIPAENITYFVNLNYNDGDPIFECSVDLPNLTTAIPIGRVMYDGTELHRTLAGFYLAENAKKLYMRAFKLRGIELVSGTSTISYLATDSIALAAGAAYIGGNYVSAGAFDSSTHTFTMVYQDGAGGWKEGNPLTGTDIAFVDGGGGNDSITQTAAKFIKAGYVVGDELTITGSTNNNITTEILAVTAGTIEVGTGLLTTEGAGASVTLKVKKHKVDFAHYDDGTGELALIKNAKYGNFWVWRHADDGHVYIVYGRDSYSLAAAESALMPTHPDHLDDFGAWIGTFGMPYGGGSFSYILMAGIRSFSGAAVGDHALLSNLLISDSGHTISTTDKLLGRSTAGAGAVEEITLTAAGRALLDDVDAAAQRATLDVDQAGTGGGTDVTLNASATAGGLSITDQEISNRAATNAQTGYATAAHITAIEVNTAKNTNVPTSLTIGTKTGTTMGITSDGGADDVILPAATTTEAGLMTEAQFDKLDGIEAGADNSTDVTLNASATAGGLSITGQEISNRAATNAQTGYATAAHIQAIEANTAKTGVTTEISDIIEDTTPQLGGDLDTNGKTINLLSFDAAIELTISSGVVTKIQTLHTIDTEADAITDDLVTINGGANGDVIYIRAANAARDIVLKDGTGNLELNGSDITLDNTSLYVCLIYDSTLVKWVISGGSGGSGGGLPTIAANTERPMPGNSGSMFYATDIYSQFIDVVDGWMLTTGTGPNNLSRVARKTGTDWDGAASVAFSPDGKYVAVVNYDIGAVEVMNVSDLSRVTRKIGTDWGGAHGVAFSPDGKYVAVASYGADAVEVMNVSDLSRVARKTGTDWDGAASVAFSPDGKYVAVASYDADAVEVMNVSDLSRVSRQTGADWNGAYGVAFSPDGKYLAVASYGADAVEVMNVSDLSRVSRQTGTDWNGAMFVAFSPDGKYVAVVSYDADAVEVMNVSDLSRVTRKTNTDWEGAFGVAFSPDGKYLATASSTADAVEIMHVPDLSRVARKTGTDWNGVHSVAFSPDGEYLAMASSQANSVEITR